MAKFYGSNVKTGRVGGSVFSVRFGETIERQYQPEVFNPNTVPQVTARARMKLMSQLAAILSSVIAFKRDGVKSGRNLFVSKNYSKTTFSQETEKASIDMLALDLTGSAVGLPAISVNRGAGQVALSLANGDQDIDEVIYAVVQVQSDDTIRVRQVIRVTEAGVNNTYSSGEVSLAANVSGYVYAYGVRYNSADAKARYGDLTPEGQTATLEVIRKILQDNVTLTETNAAVVPLSA